MVFNFSDNVSFSSAHICLPENSGSGLKCTSKANPGRRTGIWSSVPSANSFFTACAGTIPTTETEFLTMDLTASTESEKIMVRASRSGVRNGL